MKKKQIDKLSYVKQDIVNKVIERLESTNELWESGVVPVVPYNMVSSTRYKGMNFVNLLLASKKYDDERWLTLTQIKNNGWRLQRGAIGQKIVFWQNDKEISKDEYIAYTAYLPENLKYVWRDDETGKYYAEYVNSYNIWTVFNAKQLVEDIPNKEFVPTHTDKDVEKWIQAIKNHSFVKITEKIIDCPGYYTWGLGVDEIVLNKQFSSNAYKLSTLLHELTHSVKVKWNKNDYKPYDLSVAYEELVAVFGEIIISARYGFPIESKDHIVYVQSWLEALKNNYEYLFKAFYDAEERVEWLNQNLFYKVEASLKGLLENSNINQYNL